MRFRHRDPWARMLRLFSVVLVCAQAHIRPAQCAPRANEHAVMAAFLLHFVEFTTWPQQAFKDSGTPFVVGVVGTDPFGDRLDEVFQGETVRGRGFVVKRLGADESAVGCHLVFVGERDEGRTRRLLKSLHGIPVLTLSARPRFCEEGGMVAFTSERGKVAFAIHSEAVKSVGLSIHSRLLKMAVPHGLTPPR